MDLLTIVFISLTLLFVGTTAILQSKVKTLNEVIASFKRKEQAILNAGSRHAEKLLNESENLLQQNQQIESLQHDILPKNIDESLSTYQQSLKQSEQELDKSYKLTEKSLQQMDQINEKHGEVKSETAKAQEIVKEIAEKQINLTTVLSKKLELSESFSDDLSIFNDMLMELNSLNEQLSLLSFNLMLEKAREDHAVIETVELLERFVQYVNDTTAHSLLMRHNLEGYLTQTVKLIEVEQNSLNQLIVKNANVEAIVERIETALNDLVSVQQLQEADLNELLSSKEEMSSHITKINKLNLADDILELKSSISSISNVTDELSKIREVVHEESSALHKYLQDAK